MSNVNFHAVIPARMASTRLPEKPLKLIAGVPMVVRVAARAESSGAQSVVVATDDARIVEACSAHGVKALLTNANHPTGTDRLSEAVTIMGLDDEDIVVNVQGDEPLIPPEVVREVAELLADNPDCDMATAAHEIHDIEEFLNPNVVKVALDHAGKAITFSRAPIPWPRDAFREDKSVLPADLHPLRHIGLYAYKVKFLKQFPRWEQAPIEKMESLEQLRALWY
jgi:3-deoxy-manno-octulosonate cytidylyltransferase (CMP-KDO synthetase)